MENLVRGIKKLELLIAAGEAVLNAYLSRFVSAHNSKNIHIGKLEVVKIQKEEVLLSHYLWEATYLPLLEENISLLL